MSELVCRHCGEGIREATEEEYADMGWDRDIGPIEHKHTASNRWLCGPRYPNMEAEPVSPSISRWNMPKEELDLSMIEGRDAWGLMVSAMQYCTNVNNPAFFAFNEQIDYRLAYAMSSCIIMGICIELAKESLGGGE